MTTLVSEVNYCSCPDVYVIDGYAITFDFFKGVCSVVKVEIIILSTFSYFNYRQN